MFDVATRVLIVDDMLTMRKLVGKICKEIGFTQLTEATNGALAWEAISGAVLPFGLVISDWNMPNSTGLDLLKRVRGDGRFKTLPFVMVTAEAEKHQIDQAIAAGVSNYILKPFSANDLRTKLEETHKRILAA